MLNAPTVSVTMPAHNSARYIAQAIESILTQDFADFELIIIDDGSTDSTAAIIARYAASDRRIRWHSRPNRGIVATRRELLEMCRGRYLAILDSDDIALPGRLDKAVAYLDANPACVAVGGAIEVIDSDGDVLCTWTQPEDHDTIDARMLGAPGLFMAASTTTMRTEWVLRVGGYDHTTNGAEDLDLLLRLAEHGRLANLPDPLAQYRLHFANHSIASRECQQQRGVRIVQAALDRRGLPPVSLPPKAHKVETRAQVHRKWAWWALASHNHRAARKHARRALLRSPFSAETWRLLASLLRSRYRRPTSHGPGTQ